MQWHKAVRYSGAKLQLASVVFALIGALVIGGCSTPGRTMPGASLVAALPVLERPAGAIGEDDGIDDEFIGVAGRPLLVSSALNESEPLPELMVRKVSFSNVSLYDAIRTITDGMDIAMAVTGDHPGAQILRRSVSVRWLSGSLKDTLDDLSHRFGFFWAYRKGTLYIEPDRQFITNIPPVNDLFESLPIMFKTLGATDVFLDKTSRAITFRASPGPYDRINEYLKYVRENKSLIVYDTYIWEVRLNDESRMGINWRSLPLAGASSAGMGSGVKAGGEHTLVSVADAASLTNGVGVGMTFVGSRFAMNLLMDFLRSQGTLNSLSQPKVQVLSGGKAFVKRDITTGYVSRIAPSIASGGVLVPGSVETGQISTGIYVTLSGDVSDGTVYTDINVKVSDLLGMQPVQAGGTTIELPKTASSEVSTVVRSRPADVILLAGIQIQRIANDAYGLPGVSGHIGLPTRSDKIAERSELVIVLRPRIKRFVPRGGAK